MAEPQPPNVQEGDTTESSPAAGAAEDRKAAAAMSSLDSRGEDDSKKEIDQKALGDAMQQLDVGAKNQGTQKEKTDKAAAEKKPLVKVDAADVNLLVDQLDMSKIKATELLRAHDADAVKAMTAWVTASV